MKMTGIHNSKQLVHEIHLLDRKKVLLESQLKHDLLLLKDSFTPSALIREGLKAFAGQSTGKSSFITEILLMATDFIADKAMHKTGSGFMRKFTVLLLKRMATHAILEPMTVLGILRNAVAFFRNGMAAAGKRE
jgi:hypothetical protein